MGPSSDFTNSHMKRDLPEELVFGVHSTNVCSGSVMNRNYAKHQKGDRKESITLSSRSSL